MQNINSIGGGPRFPLSPIIKSYSAIITQDALAGPPTTLVTILDQIGFPKTWTKDAAGQYHIISTNDWTDYAPYTNYLAQRSFTTPRQLGTRNIEGGTVEADILYNISQSGDKIRIDIDMNASGSELYEFGNLKIPEIRIFKLL